MSKVVCVAGESGSGKTTSMRNLDPKTTLYIDCDKKGLSWKGWRSQYNSENQNYIKTDFAQVVQQTLQNTHTGHVGDSAGRKDQSTGTETWSISRGDL